MKITLFALNGSYSHTNLAIRRLRVPLVSSGFDVFLLEGGLRDTDSSLLEQLVGSGAAVFGFSCYIWNISRMTLLAENLRALMPNALIAFGGPEVSYDSERFTSLPYIDCVIRGAGETALTDVCSAFRDGKRPPRTVDGGDTGLSDGILYGKDEPLRRTLYYESAVGCPFSCSFCLSSVTKGVKAKSVGQTLDELYRFEALDGDFIVKFVDRTFNYDIARANAIWRGLCNPKYTKRYQFEICAPLLNDESYEILSRFPSGRVQLEAGLQSTNPRTLDSVARHLDAKSTLDACRRLMSSGNVHLHLDLIAGLPYESYERFGESFDAAYPVCHQLQLGFLKLLHGTELRRDAEKYGYVFTSEPPYTVLKNSFISYEKLRRLEHIADLVERFRNSGHFSEGLGYSVPCAASPFAFFEGLYDHIMLCDGRDIRKIGQADAYSLLYSYARKLPGADDGILTAKLHADFSGSEVRRVPRFADSSDKE